MLEGVLTQVPEDLPQLVGVGAHLEVSAAAQGEPRSRELHGVAELLTELLDPERELQPLDAGGLAA